jgi:hypothetical protein
VNSENPWPWTGHSPGQNLPTLPRQLKQPPSTSFCFRFPYSQGSSIEIDILLGQRHHFFRPQSLLNHQTTHIVQIAVLTNTLAPQESKVRALFFDAELNMLTLGLPPYYWASFEIMGDPDGTVAKGNTL